jgi:hypothetical protein
MTRKFKKTCAHCIHSRKIKDTITKDFIVIPGRNECVNPRVRVNFMEKYNWDEEILANECEYFEPKIIDKCSNCEKEIKKPEWSWDLWVESIFGKFPVCSVNCKEILEEKIEKSMEKAREQASFEDFKKRTNEDMET